MERQEINICGRFAPSPTGRMHLGNVFAALISYLSVKSQGGEWVLRIEDLDRGRCRSEYSDQLKRDLELLGLEWDRGGDKDYCQSERSDIYESYLNHLEELSLTYPCWCTRAELLANGAPHESDGRSVYSGLCRGNEERARKFAGKPAAIRICVPDSQIEFTDRHYGRQSVNLASHCGDFVIRRSDGSWAYQLAVVIDDALMGISEVVRGRDLLLSAAQQIYLFDTLGFKSPEYAHFPLLCSEDGRRLSKRDRSLELGYLLENHSPAEIIGYLAFLAGIIEKDELCTPAELIKCFSWEKIPTEDIIVKSEV